MRRSRTPTTAWPAVADLMTVFAVVGLSAAVAVLDSRQGDDPETLRRMLHQRDSVIEVLQDSIARIIDPFVPCWRGRTQGKRYFYTYDVTYEGGRYSLSPHADFEAGIEAGPRLPGGVERVIRELPGPMDESGLRAFGQAVEDAVAGHYREECKLAVTINPQATGREVSAIVRAGFFPVYRSGR